MACVEPAPACSRLYHWPRTISHSSPTCSLWGQCVSGAFSASLGTPVPLFPSGTETLLSRSSLSTQNLKFVLLIPSTGLWDSADVTTVVFKCRISPVSYLVSSCWMLMMSILLGWCFKSFPCGFGMLIKGLFLGCKNVRRYALNRADWWGEFLVYMRFWHFEAYFSSNS